LVAVTVLAMPITRMAPWEIPGLLLRRVLQSFADHDMSNLTRVYAWRAAVGAFMMMPITGIGWGGFGFWFYTLVPEGAGAHFGWPVTNSLPLRLLAETGLVGMGLWILAARPVFRGFTSEIRQSGGWSEASFFLGALCVGALFQSLTFSQLQLPHLWLLFGVTAAVAREHFQMV
jgi:O-antigen ligase